MAVSLVDAPMVCASWVDRPMPVRETVPAVTLGVSSVMSTVTVTAVE